MNGAESTVVVPLLFAKPGIATMPLLRVSIIPDGGGSPHHSIRHPFEVLDQSELPADERILGLHLPRYDRLDNYTASYVFPPKDVNQFVDDFPDGFSHLLTVLLAFYALSADHALGEDLFRPRLSEWAASAYPDKTGALRGVSRLREKIGALVAENKEIQRFGCKGVSNLILAQEDRHKLDSIEFVLVPVEGEGGECREIPVSKRELSKTQTQLEVSYGDTITRIVVHFARSFNAALELVFGADFVRRYARSLAAEKGMSARRKRSLVGVGALLVVAALLFVWYRSTWRPAETKGGGETTPTAGLTRPEDISIPGLSEEVQDPLRLAYGAERAERAPSAVVQVLVQRPGPGNEFWRPLIDGEEMSSKDDYRILFQPKEAAFFYVFQIDSSGTVDWLFPRNGSCADSFGNNPVRPGLWTQASETAKALYLDENVGIEHIYAVVTQNRWTELEEALEQAGAAPASAKPVDNAFKLKLRGVGGKHTAPPLPKEIDNRPIKADLPADIGHLVQGEAGVLVVERWFKHVSPD